MTADPSDARESDSEPAAESSGLDPVALLAIACGVAGIFVAQLLLVPVTMLLAAAAALRARNGHGDIGYAYVAFGVGAVDGILLLITLVSQGTKPPLIK